MFAEISGEVHALRATEGTHWLGLAVSELCDSRQIRVTFVTVSTAFFCDMGTVRPV